MVKQLYSLLLGMVFAVCVAHAEDSYLWWMFDAGTQIQEVNGTGFVTIDQLTGRGDAAGKTVNAIRIAAYKGGSLDGYLNMAEVDADWEIPSIYNMPTLTGSSEPYTETWNAGPSYVDLGAYATDPTASFVIELGFWDWGAGTDSELNWTVLAYSDPGTVKSLEAFIHDSNYDMQSKLEWTGGHYVVPEPTSGILLLIGGALLSLRRRRRRVDGSED